MRKILIKIADFITDGYITQLENEKKELQQRVYAWERLLKTCAPIVEEKANNILQETWKEIMIGEQKITFNTTPLQEPIATTVIKK